VPQVFQHQQGLVEEDLFGLGLRHAVLLVSDRPIGAISGSGYWSQSMIA